MHNYQTRNSRIGSVPAYTAVYIWLFVVGKHQPKLADVIYFLIEGNDGIDIGIILAVCGDSVLIQRVGSAGSAACAAGAIAERYIGSAHIAELWNSAFNFKL